MKKITLLMVALTGDENADWLPDGVLHTASIVDADVAQPKNWSEIGAEMAHKIRRTLATERPDG